jgi:hypothetical protein
MLHPLYAAVSANARPPTLVTALPRASSKRRSFNRWPSAPQMAPAAVSASRLLVVSASRQVLTAATVERAGPRIACGAGDLSRGSYSGRFDAGWKGFEALCSAERPAVQPASASVSAAAIAASSW